MKYVSHSAQLPTQLYDFLQAQDNQQQHMGIPEQILNLLSMQHNAIFANADMYDSGACGVGYQGSVSETLFYL